MLDKYNRDINYMRISLTDRCNLSCVYCKPANVQHLTHNDILSYEDILEICQAAIELGIHRFKLTGGEPCIRKGYIDFIERLKNLDGCSQVTLTTNGSLFTHEDLDRLHHIGIDGINFSIDTLDKEEYQRICGKDVIDKVLDNLDYAYSLGIPCKVNCVINDSFDEKRFDSMISLIKDKKIALRFIEQMPLKYSHLNSNIDNMKEYIFSHYSLHEYKKRLGNGPAHYYKVNGYEGYLGFIEAMHHKFCHQCNRIRLTSIGRLKLCLFYLDGVDLKPYIHDSLLLKDTIQKAIYMKPKEHNFLEEKSETVMNETGG